MEKINIANLLRNCPKDMEIDCVMYQDVYFDYVDTLNIIHCYIQYETHKSSITFNQFGTPNSDIKSKCVIFPKGKNTWEGFHRPFTDGDIVFYDNCVSIFKEWGDETLFRNYVKVDIDGRHPMLCDRTHSNGKDIKREARFATEEEKAKLFKAIKDNGYRWNEETKTLEKLPIFKVGNKIRHKENKDDVFKIDSIDMDNNLYCCGRDYIQISYQDKYELIPDKFDINTLIPFESKVLVRNKNYYKWEGALFGRYDGNTFFTLGGIDWKYCIPYEGNEHLHGTTNSCDDYFKTWKDE